MNRTITALFDSRDDAERAQRRLQEIGVSSVNITSQDQGDSQTSRTAGSSIDSGSQGSSAWDVTRSAEPVQDVTEGDYGRDQHHQHQLGGQSGGGGGGLWASIKNMFSDDDRSTYEEGLRRGHFLLTAQVDDDRTDEAIRILETSDAVDVDQRSQEWQASGWSRDDQLKGIQGDDTLRGTSGDDALRTGGSDRLAGTEERIPVVEEQLRVGKREVERGGVRVRSYVTEKPVHEQVSLHEEHAVVERRPVDQPLSASGLTGGDLFQERTIEVTERAEEAVVAKEARVVEEVVVRKEGSDRTETIDDTVRRTDVDVDDTRSGVVGEQRAFTATDTSDAGLDPTSGEIPGETEEERRRRLAYSASGGDVGTSA